MKPTWDLKELRDDIRRKRSDSDELLEVVHSIDRYIQIFLFHMEGARDAMDEVVDPDDPQKKEYLDFVFGNSERQDDYYYAKLASEAHILGTIHSARAIFDVFAFLINRLLLNGAIPDNRCDIRSVTRALQSPPLKSELDALIETYWFRYVSAFINTAKHRMLVNHSFHVGLEDPYTGIRIGAFEYNGKEYPRYEVRELLEGVLGVKNKIVDCGRLLNDQALSSSV